jgi:hypothetical protein
MRHGEMASAHQGRKTITINQLIASVLLVPVASLRQVTDSGVGALSQPPLHCMRLRVPTSIDRIGTAAEYFTMPNGSAE